MKRTNAQKVALAKAAIRLAEADVQYSLAMNTAHPTVSTGSQSDAEIIRCHRAITVLARRCIKAQQEYIATRRAVGLPEITVPEVPSR